MEANKRAWETPELTVLVRSRPEEAVLAGCKTSLLKDTNITAAGCRKNGGCQQTCLAVGTS